MAAAPDPADYAAVAKRYAQDVAAGRILAGRPARLACKRHLEDLKRARSDPTWPYRFDAWHANDVCGFAEKLPHVEGRWATPTLVLEPWQVFGLAAVFGWRRRSDGGRRFSKVYWEVARKNAKSTLAAVVALYCLCCEGEPAPYVLIGATTGAQAQKVFHPARQMAAKTPALCEAFDLKVWAKSITEGGGGYIQTINSKGSTQDGHNPHLGVLDELHAHKDRSLYDVIDSAFGARLNPLLWIITTAGFDTQGICYEQRRFVLQVLEGVLQADHYFGLIFTLDDGDDPFDPAVWIKANPNLGVSVQLANMQAASAEARAQPGKRTEFETKRLNRWCSARGGHINVEKWKACSGAVDLEALRTVPCWLGYDLSATSDFTSLRLIWWVGDRLKTWGTRYLPEAAVQSRTERNSVPYARWVNTPFMGKPLIQVTPGDVTDYTYIERDIRLALAYFNVQRIGFDSWRSQDLNNRLMADGAPLIEVKQNHSTLSGPVADLDRLYLAGKLDHGGDEVLTWCASNMVAKADDNGNLKPSKKLSNEKIDDIAALLNAMAVSVKPDDEEPSVYEERGLLVI